MQIPRELCTAVQSLKEKKKESVSMNACLFEDTTWEFVELSEPEKGH